MKKRHVNIGYIAGILAIVYSLIMIAGILVYSTPAFAPSESRPPVLQLTVYLPVMAVLYVIVMYQNWREDR